MLSFLYVWNIRHQHTKRHASEGTCDEGKLVQKETLHLGIVVEKAHSSRHQEKEDKEYLSVSEESEEQIKYSNSHREIKHVPPIFEKVKEYVEVVFPYEKRHAHRVEGGDKAKGKHKRLHPFVHKAQGGFYNRALLLFKCSEEEKSAEHEEKIYGKLCHGKALSLTRKEEVMIVQRPEAEYKSVYLNEAVSLFLHSRLQR